MSPATATEALKWGLVGATTVTAALLPTMAPQQPESLVRRPNANVRSLTASEADPSVSRFYDVLDQVEAELGSYSHAYAKAVDQELFFDDLYMDADADLPPRNADRWRDIEVNIIRAERPGRGGVGGENFGGASDGRSR